MYILYSIYIMYRIYIYNIIYFFITIIIIRLLLLLLSLLLLLLLFFIIIIIFLLLLYIHIYCNIIYIYIYVYIYMYIYIYTWFKRYHQLIRMCALHGASQNDSLNHLGKGVCGFCFFSKFWPESKRPTLAPSCRTLDGPSLSALLTYSL